jgi:TRAP-type C4-dicarboxylate transport system substrate-binding protein
MAARVTLGAALALATLPAMAQTPAEAPAAHDKPVQLKLSHWVPPAHPLQAAIQDWADDVKKESGGSITSVIFPSEQLGKAYDHYDMARDGIADLAYVNPGYQPGRFPIDAAGELPFLVGDAKTGTGAFDEWYRPYAAREMKDVHYCFGFINDYGTIHSRKQITVPADISGLKLRPADATIGAFVTLLGGSNVQASAPGSRDLLERGVADGIFFPWGSTVLFGIDKVVKYHLELPLYVTTFTWVMNQAKYNAMTAAQKQVIDHHCTTEWAVRFATPWVDFEHAGIAKIAAEPGHVLTKPTPEQVTLWRNAAEPLRQSWAAGARKAGVDPEIAFKALQDELAKYKAGF